MSQIPVAITCITRIEREDKTENTGNHHPAVSDESGSVMLALSHFIRLQYVVLIIDPKLFAML